MKNNEKTWINMKAAKEIFGVGRVTVEQIAQAADAKRKVGRRALYNADRMSAWLDDQSCARG